MPWYWVSLADPTRPLGQQTVGVMIVESDSPETLPSTVESKSYYPRNRCLHIFAYPIAEPGDMTLVDRLLEKDEIEAKDIGERFRMTSDGQVLD